MEQEDRYQEMKALIEQAKEQGSVEAYSLEMMIQSLQENQKVKDIPLSKEDQTYTSRQQRLLRALHQSQFRSNGELQVSELSLGQRNHLESLVEAQQAEKEAILDQLQQAQADLEKARPIDRDSLEADHIKLRQQLNKLEQKHYQARKKILFPEGISQSPMVKDFHQTLRTNIRQQLSLLDAIDAGLAERKESILEQAWKEAIAQAVGQVGEMVISNAPIPASGILAKMIKPDSTLAKVIKKGTELVLDKIIDKITEGIQEKASYGFEASAAEGRTKAEQTMGGYENNAMIAEGLSAIYTYRLQNILPILTEKSTKDLATRLAASVISYLQDKKRTTNPINLTQLATMSFYQMKGATLGDLIKKVKGNHGLKKIDGSHISYTDLFSMPSIETPDGAQYQLIKEDKKAGVTSGRESEGALPSAAAGGEGGSTATLTQIAPLIEKAILENKQLTKKKTLTETVMPKLSPAQVALIQDHDDTDYARKALEFVQELE
jgi:hypothetical protein